MSIKLGNTSINKAYLGNTEIQKMYLGNTLIYDNTGTSLKPIMTNFRVEDGSETLVKFDTPLGSVSGIDYTDFTISGKTISAVNTTSNYFTVTSAFDYWQQAITIRKEADNSVGCYDFLIERVVNDISEPSASTYKYVDVTGGGDGSEGSPWSISQMNSGLVSGETAWVKAGDYGDQKIVMTGNGLVGSPKKIIGYKTSVGDITDMYWNYGDALDAAEMPLIDGSGSGFGMALNSNYLIVRNIQVDNYDYGIDNDGEYNVWDNLLIHDTQGLYGIHNRAAKLSSNTLKNSTVLNAENALIRQYNDFNLIEGCKFYDNNTSDPSRADYYISQYAGSNNVFWNNHVERKGTGGHEGHGISLKSSLEDTHYNLVENNLVKGINQALEFRHSDCKYSVSRGNEFQDGDDTGVAGAIVFRDGTSYCTSIDDYANGVKFAVRYGDSTEDGGTQITSDNCDVINMVGDGNTNVVLVAYTPLSGTNNRIINSTFKNISALTSNSIAGSWSSTNEFTNCIFDSITNRGSSDAWTFTNNLIWDSWATSIGTGSINVNPDLDVNFKPQATFTDIDVPRIDGVYYGYNGSERLDPTTVGSVLSDEEAIATETVYPTEISDPLINPGKGWVIYRYTSSVNAETLAKGSVYYARLYWTDIEAVQGVFDWTVFDQTLNDAINNNMKFAIGVPATNNGQGTPQWLFDDAGCSYTLSDIDGTSKIPVWDDPVFIDKITALTNAIGARYDGNDDIAYIDNRTYGNWGEWHLGGLGGVKPSDTVLSGFVDMFNTAFTQTQVIQPNAEQKEYARDTYNNGWRQDSAEAPTLWDSLYGNSTTAPAVAEMSNSYGNIKAGDTWYGGSWDDNMMPGSINGSKYSYYSMGAWNNTGQEDANLFNAEKGYLIDQYQNILGYWFKITSATYSDNLGNGSQGTISFNVRNDGVAIQSIKGKTGMVKIALLDDSYNVLQSSVLSGINPSDWTPENVIAESSTFSFISNPLGTKLAIGVFSDNQLTDPDTKLGIENGINNWYVLNEAYSPGLGDELITEGTFDNGGAAWSLGSEWSIVSEEATSLSTTSWTSLSQSIGTLTGKTLRVSFDYNVLSGSRGGTVYVCGTEAENFGNSGIPEGSRTYDIVASTETLVGFNSSGSSGDSYKIDNVSIKEVL